MSLKNALLSGVIAIVVCCSCIAAYHHFYLRPSDILTVDFKALSDAKLAMIMEETMRTGEPVGKDDLEKFIAELQEEVRYQAEGRPVFVSGALFGTKTDMTQKLAALFEIDLTKNMETLMRNRLESLIPQPPSGE